MEKKETSQPLSILSAMFLVAGTCIGGGMLALPVATGINGFLPSLVVMLVCYFAMTATALLLLEASLWMHEDDVHTSTMTVRLLGKKFKILTWLLFLFISYASIVAYTAGAGIQIASTFEYYLGIHFSKDIGALIFILIFGSLFYVSNVVVGRVNSILFVGMLLAYFGLVMTGINEVNPKLLIKREWSGSLMVLPLLLTAFSFQTMVPSLTPLLKKNSKALQKAIIGGTTLTLLIYLIWQLLILGIVPVDGPFGLKEALEKGEPATQFLREHVTSHWLVASVEFFSFFAIATSFLGISLGLFDFLSDGLKIKKKGFGKLALMLIVMVPTYIIAVKYERIFLIALYATGGYGDTILNGLIPVAMVWVGRYRLGYKSESGLPGGKPLLVIIFCFFFVALMMEILNGTGYIDTIYELYDVFKFKG